MSVCTSSQRNQERHDYKTKIYNMKVKVAIAKAGEPPTVVQEGKNVQMCASYHL